MWWLYWFVSSDLWWPLIIFWDFVIASIWLHRDGYIKMCNVNNRQNELNPRSFIHSRVWGRFALLDCLCYQILLHCVGSNHFRKAYGDGCYNLIWTYNTICTEPSCLWDWRVWSQTLLCGRPSWYAADLVDIEFDCWSHTEPDQAASYSEVTLFSTNNVD